MTKSTITRERIELIANFHRAMTLPPSHDEIEELARMALAAMDSEPHTDDELSNLLWYSQEATCHSDPNYYCEFQRLATPGFIAGIIRELQERRKADSEPVENHIGSKNSLDAIVSFIKSKSNPTVKCYEEVSEQLFKDNCHGIHSHVIEYILKLGEELEDFRAEQAEMTPAQPVADSEPDRNPVLAYADSYRDMAKQGVESVPIWSVITDLERNIAPLYRHAQPAPERDQVRIAHAEWSQATFGNVGPVGPLKHLSKEALEAAAEPGDLSEWADMQLLLWDAQRRAGIADEQITQAMIEKLAVNKQRKWPEPKDGEPRLHIKEQPAPVVQKLLTVA